MLFLISNSSSTKHFEINDENFISICCIYSDFDNDLHSVYLKPIYNRIHACTINIYVPRGVKIQRIIAKKTSQIMKYGQDVIIQNEQMYKIPKWEVVLGARNRETYLASCMTPASVN